MKLLWTLTAAVVLTLGLSPLVRAQDDEKKQERRGADRAANLFKRLDANGDGKVTAEEIPAERRSFFERLLRADEDKDGALSQKEFVSALRSRQTPGTPGRRPGGEGGRTGTRVNPDQILERFDQNKDGKVTLEEVPERARPGFKRLFERADRNKDGALSREELAAAFRRPQPPRRPEQPRRPRATPGTPGPAGLFGLLDINRDGKLSTDELASASKLIEKLDRDGDGAISAREVAAASRRTTAVRRPRRRPEARPAAPAPAARVTERLLKRYDKDGDGKVSREEAKGRFQKQFDRLDSNSDGQLDKGEIAASVPRAAAAQPKKRRPAATQPKKRSERAEKAKKATKKKSEGKDAADAKKKKEIKKKVVL